MPSFILIRPTVWPQYTNVTDRTDRQRSVCPVCNVGRIKMKLGMQVGLGPGHIALDWYPAALPQRGTAPNFPNCLIA